MFRVVVIFGLVLAVMSTRAADLKLEAKLIWGSNDPTDKVQHPSWLKTRNFLLDLHRIFKWDNYYEINTKDVSIPQDENRHFADEREMQVGGKESRQQSHRSKLHRQRQASQPRNHSLPPGQWFTLGGNDKNNSAWFVVMRSTSTEPTTAGKKD